MLIKSGMEVSYVWFRLLHQNRSVEYSQRLCRVRGIVVGVVLLQVTQHCKRVSEFFMQCNSVLFTKGRMFVWQWDGRWEYRVVEGKGAGWSIYRPDPETGELADGDSPQGI